MTSNRPIYLLTLEALFGAEGIAADANGDGYPDRLRICIGVERGLADAGVWAQILNLAARLAGEVTALDPPVVRPLQQVAAGEAALVVHRPSKNHPAAVELRRSGRAVHLAGRSASGMAELLYSLAVHPGRKRAFQEPWRCLKSAEGGTSVVEAFDRRGRPAGRYRLSPVRPAAEKPGGGSFGLLDLARTLYRVAEENPRAAELALNIDLPGQGLSFPVGLALAEVAVRAALEATAMELPLAACGSGPVRGVSLRIEERPGRDPCLTVEADESAGSAVIRAAGDARRLAGLLRDWLRIGLAAGGPADAGARSLRGRIDMLLSTIAAEAPLPVRGAPAPIRGRLRWRSETERLIESVRRTPPGRGAIQGLALISKPRKERAQVRREIARLLRAKGYAPAVVVLNAYKPGLSWLREVVQPALEAMQRVARVRIACREFAADPPGLEMRSRWLQELYPGPDLLARGLGLPLERIGLSLRKRLREGYLVTAWDRGGARVYRAGFTPRVSRLPYLPGHPELGQVHPCTGGIRLVQAGRVVVDESLPTDRERFWCFFQQNLLPALEGAMASRVSAGGGLPSAFWEEVAVDVRIPETDERLGIGAERIAPLEALHEDLYFVLLDHFRLFAETHRLPADSQFGRILPRVSTAAAGKEPEAAFRAVPFTGLQQPAAKSAAASPAATNAAARIASMGMEAGRLVFEIEAGGATEAMCGAARSRGLDVSMGGRTGRFVFRAARPRATAAGGRAGAEKARAAAPPLNRLLPLQEVERWVRRLGKSPHLGAWRAGTSWQGRGIWAIEAALEDGGRLASLARARLLKPTLLLIARHHANEVSSTSAALRLAWELASTPWGRRTLDRVNVAIVPIENVDGVATLEELLPGCEDHKLHAARYNALGVEWYGDYFLERPRFPEARVKPRLWRRWLPLLVLDAHGVPSHEWDQPFSGYAPGRFRPFWIPRAFLYAIMPHIDQPSHPGHGPARAIARAMSRAVRAERGIRQLDIELKDRYGRYARAWDPEVFPPVGGRELTILPSEARLAGLNFGVQRYPVTVSEIVTEVTDEVVSGRLLEQCARAHLTVARALLEWLGRQASGRLIRKQTAESGLVMSWAARSRPREAV
jgi:hypothetical protein